MDKKEWVTIPRVVMEIWVGQKGVWGDRLIFNKTDLRNYFKEIENQYDEEVRKLPNGDLLLGIHDDELEGLHKDSKKVWPQYDDKYNLS